MTIVRDELFSQQGGARKGVPKILFVLTDGKSTRSPLAIAKELRDSGITIISIGITDSCDVTELQQISDGRAYMAKNWSMLLDATFIESLTKKVCKDIGKFVV